MIRYIVRTGCTICGMCANVCPVQAIQILHDGAHIDPDKCTGCGLCYRNCASEAIQKVTTQEKREQA